MPKQILKIDQFHGGLNSNSDARDIAENELSDAIDIMVDEIGKVRLMGGVTSASITARTNQINPGYGLFQFSHDRTDGHTVSIGADDPETGADYLVFSEPDTAGTVDIYSAEDTTWGSPITGMTNNTGGLRKDIFYTVDGALRICDSEFGNTNSNKWYGYVDRTHFSGLTPGGSADTYDQWHATDAEIAAPTAGIAGVLYGTADATGTTNLHDTGFFDGDWNTQMDAGLHIAVNKTEHKSLAISALVDVDQVTTGAATQWSGDSFALYPAAGTGFNLALQAPSGTGGTIPAGTYEFGSTFIYDAEPGEKGSQESLVFTIAGTSAVSAGQYWGYIQIFPTSPYDARITGGRIYVRIEDSGDEWQMIREISLKDGTRREPSADYIGWGYQDNDNNNVTIHLYSAHSQTSLSPFTYSLNTGIDQDTPSLTAKYKTAVIANRVAYIGNVQYNSVIHADSILQSRPNKFDMFFKDGELAASISDGDPIVKLEEYADRILQFKKKKMQLINISQYGSEFLEDTFMHKGVQHTAATCKTDFGIAWVNRQGCYLYDGQKVNNLLEKGGRQIIKESDWASFTTDNSIIGYLPKKRQLIVLKDCTATSAGDIYLFDLVTQSWIKGDTAFTDSEIQTNFVTDWNGDLVHINDSDTGTVVKWDDAADASTAMVMSTKDIDFGQPGQKKTVYKVIITYQSSNATTHVQVDYGVNGDTTFAYDFTVPELPAADGWQQAELVPDVLSEASNIKSFRLRFATDGTVPTGFEINDVSIVYRLKGMR
jgi:hypothetical protein